MTEPDTAPGMTMLTAADLQDNLLAATLDLERLQTLLDDSHQTLQEGFFGLMQLLGEAQAAAPTADPDAAQAASRHLSGVVKALQFQDMSSQLITHTSRRLHNCADRLARDAFAGDGEGDAVVEEAPMRPNPVTQSEMDTGFVELF